MLTIREPAHRVGPGNSGETLAEVGSALAARPYANRGVAVSGDTPRSRRARYESLSERERSVLRLVAEGYNGPEIGDRLGITAKTVDTYKQRIEDKLGLSHRTEYVRFALGAGLLGKAS